MLKNVLSLSEALSFVLKGSQRLLNNLRYSLTFLGCFEEFWSCLGRSHEFPAVANGSLRLWGILWLCMVVLRSSEVFSWVLNCSERFLSILRDSLMFLGVLSSSHGFWAVLYDLRHSLTFWRVMRRSHVIEGFYSFLQILRCSVTCWSFLRHSDALLTLWHVLRYSELFIWVLSCIERFQNL